MATYADEMYYIYRDRAAHGFAWNRGDLAVINPRLVLLPMELPPKQPSQSSSFEKSDVDLLLECEVETFRSSGKGGQHVNKTESGVRVRHLPSGIVVTCRRERSQYLNKKTCLQNLRRKLEDRSKPVIPRVATRPTYSSKKRRVVEKKLHGQRKSMRRSPDMD